MLYELSQTEFQQTSCDPPIGNGPDMGTRSLAAVRGVFSFYRPPTGVSVMVVKNIQARAST